MNGTCCGTCQSSDVGVATADTAIAFCRACGRIEDGEGSVTHAIKLLSERKQATDAQLERLGQ